MFKENLKYAKPFLKWAGGKTQLLDKFVNYFPPELAEGKIENYYEPFLGSGAVFFYIVQNYPIKKAFLSDINEELVLTFKVVQKDPYNLIEELKGLHNKYHSLTEKEQESFFYSIRDEYNSSKTTFDFKKHTTLWANRAAKMVFLNKTCFNGLYRLNRKGEFNVPFGRYKNPKILDVENIYNSSNVLQIADIFVTDFEKVKRRLSKKFFVYFDPPYRPLSKTASFTSYSKGDFSDIDQIRLANFFRELGDNGNKLMLSNSDPLNTERTDDFYIHHYNGFIINRVKALRVINCKADKRSAITELIITNY